MAKAPAKKEDKKPEAAAEGEEQQPKKKGKLPLILALAVVLIGGGGGGAYFFLFKGKAGDAAQETKHFQPKPPVFVPLENFTVNLVPDSGEQYLQVAVTLKVLDSHAGDAVKQYMPEIRHRILLLLSGKKASDINTAEGRERLPEEVRMTANNILLVAAGKEPRPLPSKAAGTIATATAPAPAEAKPAEDAKPEGGEAAKPGEEGVKPQEEGTPPAAAPAQAAPAVAKAEPDDPVQGVFFTSFIIQ